LNHQWFT